MFIYYGFAYFIVSVVCSTIYIPLFYRNGITSTYEVSFPDKPSPESRLISSFCIVCQEVENTTELNSLNK